MTSSYAIAFLGNATPAMRAAVTRHATPEFSVRFFDKGDIAGYRAAMPETDIIVALNIEIGEELLTLAPKLRIIHRWGVGLDTIDLTAAKKMGVAVAITSGVNTGPVAEFAVGLMLAVSRRIADIDRRMRAGDWVGQSLRSVSYTLAGKRIGLVGFGRIAQAVTRRLAGFESDIVVASHRSIDAQLLNTFRVQQLPLEELLKTSDIISLHAPLTSATRNLINRQSLAMMKPGAFLINTARGELIDEDALYDALQNGGIGGAGLDVWTEEPTNPNNKLLALDQVVATAHVAGSVTETIETMVERIFSNLRAVLAGKSGFVGDIVVTPEP